MKYLNFKHLITVNPLFRMPCVNLQVEKNLLSRKDVHQVLRFSEWQVFFALGFCPFILNRMNLVGLVDMFGPKTLIRLDF
jgi:hypothetical protein